jgi:DNA primase catalytic core
MPISQETIEAIKNKADIVTVISSYIEVQKKGANYVALCPFHHDTNPSMMISPSKQLFKCFVCGTGGNCFTFVMKYEGLSFIEAVKKVCKICKIDIPSELVNFHTEVKKNQEELTALEKLTEYYAYMLKTNEGKPAYSYLSERGLDEKTIQKFHLGYAPLDQTKSIGYLRTKENIPIEVLDRAGIISSSSGQLNDRYFDRVIFPLSDIHGDLVGFSGRKFREGNADAKYINSPDSVVFHKSEILYNCNNAYPAIRKEKYVYVLEGFMDVIALDRVGIEAAVGLMGTALTKEHIEFFKKMGVEVRLSLDGDEPGQTATEKCLSLLADSGLSVKVVRPLESGKDADEVLKSKGKDALVKAMNILEMPIAHSLSFYQKHNLLNSYEEKEKFLLAMKPYYLSSPYLAKEDMLNLLSNGLDVSIEAIKSFLSVSSYAKPLNKPVVAVREEESQADLTKREVCNCIYRYILPRLADERLDSTIGQPLVMTETKILTKMMISKKALEEFLAQKDVMVVDSYRDLVGYLTDFYLTLRNGVDCVMEEDFEEITGLVETFYANRKQEIVSSKSDEGKKESDEVEEERKHILGILERLKMCVYPSRTLNQKDFDRLLANHAYQKTRFDLMYSKLDEKTQNTYLERLALNYPKNDK